MLDHLRLPLTHERSGYEAFPREDEDDDDKGEKASSKVQENKKMKAIIVILGLCLILSVLHIFGFLPSSSDLSARREKALLLPTTHYLLPATKANPFFCAGLMSALVHDAEPIIINWGGVSTRPQVYFDKIRKTNDYLQRYTKPDDVVIMLDSVDTILQRPLMEVVSEFRETGKQIMFAAEKSCCCRPETKERPVCSGLPNSTLPSDLYGMNKNRFHDSDAGNAQNTIPKYLNSGNVIGYAKHMQALYRDLVDFMDNDPYGKTFVDDQSIFLDFYWQNKHGMSLDYTGKVAKSIYSSDQDLIYAPRIATQSEQPGQAYVDRTKHSIQSARLLGHSTPWLMFDIINKSWPGFMHFNGPGKGVFARLVYGQWWAGHDPVPAEVRTQVYDFIRQTSVPLWHKKGKRLTWHELCGTNMNMTERGITIDW